MPQSRNKSKRTRVVNATAAGTTNVNSTSVDMLSFEEVLFQCCLGTLTAGQVTSLKAQQSPDNSTWADITSAVTPNAADADSNKMLILEVYRPQQRYVRAVVQRGTANAAIDSVVAIQTGGHRLVTTSDDTATTSQSLTVIGS